MATEAIYTKSLGGAEDLLLDASNSPTVIQTRAGKELEITKINSSTIPYSGKFGDPSMVSIKYQLDTKANTVSSAYVIDTVDDFGTVTSEIDTVIVKDLNRGGIFIYDATQSAVNNGGTIFDGWVRQYTGAVNVKWFDLDNALDSTNRILIIQTVIDYCISNTKDMDFGTDITYDLGEVAGSSFVFDVDSPANISFLGNNVLFKADGQYPNMSYIFRIKNPTNFKSIGLNFTDPNFNIEDAVGGRDLRASVYGYLLFSSAPYNETNQCGNVYIEGNASNCIGLVSLFGGYTGATNELVAPEATPYGIKDINVTGKCSSTYYGVSTRYNGENCTVKLDCVNVRRGFISYGQRVASIDIKLKCEDNFLGSNGFITLGCEGDEVFSGIDTNVSGIDIKLLVNGVESHVNYVHFYHQQYNTSGYIARVVADVTIGDITTVGKNVALGNTNIYAFNHETPDGAIASTLRRLVDSSIECNGNTTSGQSFYISAIPTTVDTIKFGSILSSRLNTFLFWNIFKVASGSKVASYDASIYGKTTAGTADYTSRKMIVTASGSSLFIDVNIAWSGFNGTGTMAIGSIPIAISNAKPSIVSAFNGSFAQNNIVVMIAGNNKEFYIYSVDRTTGALVNTPPAGSGRISFCARYELYN